MVSDEQWSYSAIHIDVSILPQTALQVATYYTIFIIVSTGKFYN